MWSRPYGLAIHMITNYHGIDSILSSQTCAVFKQYSVAHFDSNLCNSVSLLFDHFRLKDSAIHCTI